MIELRSYKYRLPLKKPFITASGRYTNREGLILRLTQNKQIFWTEAAPLPGFSSFSLDEIIKIFQDHKNKIASLLQKNASFEESKSFYEEKKLPPSLQFALDSLLALKGSNYPLQLSAFKNNSDLPTSHIALNAVIGSSNKEEIIDLAHQKIKDGYKTLKFKAGDNIKELVSILEEIRQEYPTIHLRIDANCSWTLEESIKNLEILAPFELEYCEEPLQKNTPKSLDYLVSQVDVPLALDETIYNIPDIKPFLDSAATIVIKPMVLGSFTKLLATSKIANYHKIKIVFSSSIESGIGRSIIAALASIISAEQTHGIDTGSLLKNDIFNDSNCIKKGNYLLEKNALLQDPKTAEINYRVLKEITN